LRAGRYPENHPLEQQARDAQRAKRYVDTPAGRVIQEAQQATAQPQAQPAPRSRVPQPAPRRRWG
jgi:hypothetical protein